MYVHVCMLWVYMKWKSLGCVWLFVTPDPISTYSVHEILQARILEWVSISFSMISPQPKDWTWVSHIAGGFFTIFYQPPEKPCGYIHFYIKIWLTLAQYRFELHRFTYTFFFPLVNTIVPHDPRLTESMDMEGRLLIICGVSTEQRVGAPNTCAKFKDRVCVCVYNYTLYIHYIFYKDLIIIWTMECFQ